MMMRIPLSLTLILFVMLCACGKSTSPKGNSRPRKTAEERFAEMDLNKDGKLSLQEFKGNATQADQIIRLEQAFKEADTDHDGFLSLDEYKAYRQKTRSERGWRRGPYGPMGGRQ